MGPTDTGDETGTAIADADVFEILSSRRRRFVIHALKRFDEPLDVSDLSRYVSAWELDVDPEDVPYEYRHNVHSTLKRTHLPKLRAKGIVTIDEDDVIRPAPGLERIEVYVEVLRGKEIPWSRYYLGLAALDSALLVAVVLGVPGLAVLSPLTVGAVTAVSFAISALAHYLIERRSRLGTAEKPPAARRSE